MEMPRARWIGSAIMGISILLGGCQKARVAAPAGSAPAAGANALRFLALGDSYTIGESVDESQRWPVQLAAELRREGMDVGEPTIIARTGWTTADLSGAMDGADLRGPYDLVGLLIGVNNQYQGRTQAEYRIQFSELLARAVGLAGNRAGRVFVISIPDWGVTPYARRVGRMRIQSRERLINLTRSIVRSRRKRGRLMWISRRCRGSAGI